MEFMFHLLSHLVTQALRSGSRAGEMGWEVTQRCKVWGGRDLVGGQTVERDRNEAVPVKDCVGK